MKYGKLTDILGVPQEKLDALDEMMQEAGYEASIERVGKENSEFIEGALKDLELSEDADSQDVLQALAKKAEACDEDLYRLLDIDRDNFDFQKVADAARSMATESEGFFLKKEYGKQILRERRPEKLLDYLGYDDVEQLLEKEDITEIFSALRFTETNEWMHETFRVAYTKFTPDDFEYRPIEITVLGPQWEEIAKKYVEKKHHNVSHLKEFGVIFLNPISQSGRGKFVRDFALLLHYFHEIAFYSRLFQKYSDSPDFHERFIALLRGDIKEVKEVGDREWMIVQRYLWKDDPQDPRLFIPHVNPEAMHWRKAEQDIIAYGQEKGESNISFWGDMWSVAGMFGDELISFDLEDNAMMVAHKAEGKEMMLNYHQHEALWNRLFARYVGGYEKLEQHVIENMEDGSIKM